MLINLKLPYIGSSLCWEKMIRDLGKNTAKILLLKYFGTISQSYT